MPEKFKNKYRIESTRLQNWDYGWAAAYFVTICTKNREHFFGEIVETPCVASDIETPCVASDAETHCNAPLQMQLSEIGKIAKTEWLKTPVIRPDMNLILGEFVVMPNHFHGIIIIGKNKFNTQCGGDGDDRRGAMHCASTTGHGAPTTETANEFGPQSKNLASIIRGYKSAVKKYATMNNINFAWQTRFHDHIIRDGKSFDNISNYIKNNPLNWTEDQFSR